MARRPDLVWLLGPFRVHFVGVMCPVEEMERREKARGDRTIGEGRSHIEAGIHTWSRYDTGIDTHECSADENAVKLMSSIQRQGRGISSFEKRFLELKEMKRMPPGGISSGGIDNER